MNSDQITGILRAIVPPVVAWLVAKGYVHLADPKGFGDAIIAALVALGAAGWSVHNNQTGKVIGQ